MGLESFHCEMPDIDLKSDPILEHSKIGLYLPFAMIVVAFIAAALSWLGVFCHLGHHLQDCVF